MPRLLVAISCLSAGFLLARAPTAPVPKDAKKAVPYYFPVDLGAKWVYDCPNGRTESVVVAGVEKADGELVVAREAAGGQQQYAKMAVSVKGLRQDELDGRPEPVWLLKTPFRDGDTWDVPAGHGGGKRTVHGPEPVEVPAGKFTAARVVWDRPGGRRRTYWYAPGVGEVKRVEREADGTETVTRALRSFTVGKNGTGGFPRLEPHRLQETRRGQSSSRASGGSSGDRTGNPGGVRTLCESLNPTSEVPRANRR